MRDPCLWYIQLGPNFFLYAIKMHIGIKRYKKGWMPWNVRCEVFVIDTQERETFFSPIPLVYISQKKGKTVQEGGPNQNPPKKTENYGKQKLGNPNRSLKKSSLTKSGKTSHQAKSEIT